ncbi:hypothetical protein [Lactiplantibacillus modestisalitolerans]|nr:hypothetical protein [Lactiplantibacillus modestisalitolerans]
MPKTQRRRGRLIIISIIGICAVILIWGLTRPSLRDRLVQTDPWYIFSDTTVTVRMNQHPARKADRLFSADGQQAKDAQVRVMFQDDGRGSLVTKKTMQRFRWRLKKNVITLRLPARGNQPARTVHWTLAKTRGKVAGQRFQGYTLQSDDYTGQFFVGKGFLLHRS